MTHVVFIAPRFLENTNRYVQAFAELPITLSVVSMDPEEAIPAPLKPRVAGHYRVGDCLDGAQLTEAVRAIGRGIGRVDRLTGVLEKHSGEAPFDLPDAVLKVARAGKLGSWREPALNDVPVNFLTDCDTSAGHAGAPVIDGKGQLVGVNFDRVWENVANDFGYNPDVARSIGADVRYLLWIIDQVEGASSLVTELTKHP